MPGSKGYRKGNRVTVREGHAVLYDSSGKEILTDVEDLERVLQYTWYVVFEDGRYLAKTDSGSEQLHLHRYLMHPPPGCFVDFRNGDGLDCRRSNLRLLTRQSNRTKSRLSSRSTSGYKGVRRVNRRWRATITVNGKRIHLGYFDTPEEAAEAYNAAARKAFGEFARLNEIP